MRSPRTVIAAGPPAAGGTLTAGWAAAGSASGAPGGRAGSAVVTELPPGPPGAARAGAGENQVPAGAPAMRACGDVHVASFRVAGGTGRLDSDPILWR